VRFEVAAPGKLILLGEYAVLSGAPAVVMAVNRHARVELRRSRENRWRFSSPGLVTEPVDLEIRALGELRWHGTDDVVCAFGLVDRLLRELATKKVIDLEGLPPGEAVLDTRQFHRTRGGRLCKLGLGSSAALTVALASALADWAGAAGPKTPDAEWLQVLVDAHRAVQGGAGSGIDVAASAIGGVVNYRLHDDGSIDDAVPMTLPEDLGLCCIWTGKSASTGDFLAQLEASRRNRPRAVERALGFLCEVSERGVDALANHECAGFLGAVDEFWDALDALGKSIEMPILSEDHRRLRRLVGEFGMHYKPSGAGGGDFGIAFSSLKAPADEMIRRVAAEGFEVVKLETELEGVRRVGF